MNSVVAWLMGLLALIPGMGQPAVATWNGYVEEDYVYAAAPTAGPIDTIAVKEGDDVKKGAVLFTLDAAQQQASYAAARAFYDSEEYLAARKSREHAARMNMIVVEGV